MIDLTIEGGVAEVTLNAPAKLNALGPEDLDALGAAYSEAEAAGVRALVLRGEGRAFCAGRDIAGVDPREDDVLGYLEGRVEPVMRRIAEFPAPTFAVAHGACLGVGLGLLIASDVVYVAESAKIGSPFVNLGATLDSGGHALFFERLGAHRTLDLIYTGRLMTGAEAVALGLFSQALPDDDVLAAARAAAAKAADGPTQAFVASKRLIAALRDERVGFWRSMTDENRAQAALCDTDDYREGFAAFQQKRRPAFTGRA
ncbi:enoyl-CoA hydratase/isomerase family protein [Microbacterium sp. MEC084]|uniref:enoyl-CoA hydratase/isomerase family protein n=1 Tax=Microbacterium sp. MEC084 TaxID=1963027 RepID=UPI00106F6DF3|nr:enoyl-CoA hydratase-related protein [Microbacterium sp. MEC084]MCD1269154.1 enoyl-CoA hydratase/isomerase family protein [Microbacterium sp. MEC084]